MFIAEPTMIRHAASRLLPLTRRPGPVVRLLCAMLLASPAGLTAATIDPASGPVGDAGSFLTDSGSPLPAAIREHGSSSVAMRAGRQDANPPAVDCPAVLTAERFSRWRNPGFFFVFTAPPFSGGHPFPSNAPRAPPLS